MNETSRSANQLDGGEVALRRHSRALVLACLGLVCGLGLQLGEQYPLSQMSMFSDSDTGSASRVVARTAAGLVELRAVDAFPCAPPPLELLAQRCPEGAHADNDSRALEQMRDRPVDASARPVDIVRVTYALEERAGPFRAHECIIARCGEGPG